MFRRLLCFLSLSIAASAPAADAPIDDLWRHAEFQEMTLSPGGEYLAATVPDDDETRIVILDIRDFPDVKLLTALRGGTSMGVYDLELMKRRGDIPLSRFGRRFLERALGTDSEDLQQRSPAAHVDRIRADLFIAHGAEDIRAHTSQYHTLIKALENAGIRHEKLYVRGEGHGFYKPENNVLLYGNALKFFDRNIGSGYRPRDEAVVRDALEQASGGSTGE